MVACHELQEGREKNEKKKYFLHCPTLPLAKKISQKQISSENTLTFVQTNFTQTKFQQALTLSSPLKTLPRTTAHPPPTNHHRRSPSWFSTNHHLPSPALSLHFRRCRTAEPSTEEIHLRNPNSPTPKILAPMASKKKQFEGIAMLSMYNDEEEEEDEDMEDIEDIEEQEEEDDEKTERQEEDREQQYDDYMDSRMAEQDDSLTKSGDRIGGDAANDDSPPIASQNTTPQPRVTAVSPQQEAVAASESVRMNGRRKLTIVDYGHDEVAMSPEPEEGEIEGSGRVMFGSELQTANGHFQEKPPPGTVQALTASNPVTPLSSDPSYDTMNYAIQESEGAQFEEAVMEQEKEIDPLDAFLPPPPKHKCSEELQRKINKFLDYKKYGKSFNAEVRNRKDYRNPDFLLHAVRYQDINQIGSCFSKDVFDPHGYDKSDYYDEIEADMKREELEKKKNNKVEFVSGGTQSGTVAPTPKVNMPIPGVSTAAATGLLSVPPAADTTTRDGRQNKKSKWDKVDGDRRNSLSSGGQDSISAAGAHAALLSSANAGTGYMAFAQQRRREAEEKKSSERKVDRRS